ncbi:MAG TPA: hypothetical protein VKX30_08200 [Flavobacteriaceae bacterium]|nr:hypothetical protein [Flavobacteriaceae bacterium]
MNKNYFSSLLLLILLPIVGYSQYNMAEISEDFKSIHIKISESGEYKISDNYKVKAIWDDELTFDSSNDRYFGGVKSLIFYYNGKDIGTVHDIEDGFGFGEIGFSFGDYNEDGYLDFQVPRSSGKSIWYNYYIFNPEKQTWEIREDYTTYSVYQWEDEQKRIFSTRPDGSAYYGSYYFVKIFEGNRIPMAKFYYQEDSKFNLMVDHESFKETEYGGGVDIKNGHMLLLNAGANSYTLEIEGKISAYFLPKIKVDDNSFILRRSLRPPNKSVEETFAFFKNNELDVLSKLTNTYVEIDCFENSIEENNGNYYMFWNYTIPKELDHKSELWKEHTVYESSNLHGNKLYILDVIHENIFFRFAYPSLSGDEAEAKQFLMGLANGLRFYKDNIDSVKLAERIYEGETYYEE